MNRGILTHISLNPNSNENRSGGCYKYQSAVSGTKRSLTDLEEAGDPTTSPAPFEELFRGFGLCLSLPSDEGVPGYTSGELKGFKCHQQPSLLRGKIDAEVRLNPNFKKTLLEGLLEALEDENWLYCALLPMYVGTNDSSSGSDNKNCFFTQESFIKVLLGIDSLQPDVISAVLECLPDLAAAADDDTKGDGLLNSRRHVSLRLVLQQLRWIDHIVNPSALTDKLLDCAMVLDVGLQRDLITYLSDIVQDTESLRVVESLEGLLTLEESLLASILDAYTSMNLPIDVLSRIARSMMERLPSIEPTVLPVLVRFLLETSASCKDPE
eukprot:226837_1